MLLPDQIGPWPLRGESDDVGIFKRRTVKRKRYWPDGDPWPGWRLTNDFLACRAPFDETFVDKVHDGGSYCAAAHADRGCKIVRAFQTDPRLELAMLDSSSQPVANRFA